MAGIAKSITIKNKRAWHEYFILEEFIAGIQLTGTEIKSIREGKVSFVDAYCSFENGELFVRGLHIAEYRMGRHYNHDPKRSRKLLLNRRELRKLLNKTGEKGFTIVPLVVFINDNGLAKLQVALAKGKHTFDKRESLKKKDIEREMGRTGRE
jgi:SsrA-binding protein